MYRSKILFYFNQKGFLTIFLYIPVPSCVFKIVFFHTTVIALLSSKTEGTEESCLNMHSGASVATGCM